MSTFSSVTGEAGDDFNLLVREELGQVFLIWLEKHREVAELANINLDRIDTRPSESYPGITDALGKRLYRHNGFPLYVVACSLRVFIFL